MGTENAILKQTKGCLGVSESGCDHPKKRPQTDQQIVIVSNSCELCENRAIHHSLFGEGQFNREEDDYPVDVPASYFETNPNIKGLLRPQSSVIICSIKLIMRQYFGLFFGDSALCELWLFWLV